MIFSSLIRNNDIAKIHKFVAKGGERNCLAMLTFFLVLGTIPAFASDTSPKSVDSVTVSNTYQDWNTSSSVDPVSKTDICIYQPYDKFMDASLTGLILKQVQSHNVTAKIMSVKEQIENQGLECNHIIHIERAINTNDRFADKTIKYQITGSNAEIFTYKTGEPFNSNAQPLHSMTNWNCEIQAHTSKYFENYHFDSFHMQYCDPYQVNHPEKVGELSQTVIENSVDKILEAWN